MNKGIQKTIINVTYCLPKRIWPLPCAWICGVSPVSWIVKRKPRSISKFKLTVIGTGPIAKETENVKERPGITKRLRFDLHGFTLLEANKKVSELINNCQQDGVEEILFITGNGLH